ncbi:hypothetical protein KKD20_01320 [Patescibacteria group bacterium]|nr:hypothetical protein [Patescibacteria group bacterium]
MIIVWLVVTAVLAAILGGCATRRVVVHVTDTQAGYERDGGLEEQDIKWTDKAINKLDGSRAVQDSIALAQAHLIEAQAQAVREGRYGYGGLGYMGTETGIDGYDGIIGNESDHTLIVKIPAINYTSPPIPPDGFIDHIRLPEGKFKVQYIKASTGKLFVEGTIEVDARRGDNHYKGRVRDWHSGARNR